MVVQRSLVVLPGEHALTDIGGEASGHTGVMQDPVRRGADLGRVDESAASHPFTERDELVLGPGHQLLVAMLAPGQACL